jgi:hypothetical protein
MTTRFKSIVSWIITNSVGWGLAVEGTTFGIVGALNIFTFVMTIFTVCWIIVIVGASHLKNTPEKDYTKMSVSAGVAASSDFLLSCLIIAYGHWILGTLVFLQMLLEQLARIRIKEVNGVL